MKAARIGGILMVLPRMTALEVGFMKQISVKACVIEEPLKKYSLLELFHTSQKGHDGADVIDIFGRAFPWIRSSGNHLPYNAAKLREHLENYGLRHNSALYASTLTNSLIIVVSEEKATVSVFQEGSRFMNQSKEDASMILNSFLYGAAETSIES